LPLLILADPESQEHLSKEFRMDGFIAKPLEIDELLETIAALIKKKQV
jgi:hypothetical protein